MAHDLAGKVFLVTGATDGIGKAAAMDFAMRGATMTIVGRNKEKTTQVLAELKAVSGNEHLDFILGDLSRLADVRRVAEEFKAKHDRLDVLVNNAGAIFMSPQKSPDGFEMTFALNHLAYFQLTTQLLELIRRTPGARVVSTSSGAFAFGSLDLQRTPTSEDAGWSAYANSKLANILFTKELQRRLEGTSATANCFHPGYVRTAFGSSGNLLTSVMLTLGRPFAKSPKAGADSLVWLATSPDAASLKGEYIANRRRSFLTRQAKDPKLAADLWALSEKLCAQTMARAA